MPLRFEAIYEKGVLRPLQPLDLKEDERVVVSVVTSAASNGPKLDIECLEKTKRELQLAGPAPGLAEVRRRLAKIPGSMAADVIADRGER